MPLISSWGRASSSVLTFRAMNQNRPWARIDPVADSRIRAASEFTITVALMSAERNVPLTLRSRIQCWIPPKLSSTGRRGIRANFNVTAGIDHPWPQEIGIKRVIDQHNVAANDLHRRGPRTLYSSISGLSQPSCPKTFIARG